MKKGKQDPTILIKKPYKTDYGQQAIDLYNSTGRTAQKWQEKLIAHILAYNKQGLWVHTKFGYSVPRRNGKNEVVAMRELWGLTAGEHILHTAHRTSTTHTAWERLLDLLEKAKIPIASEYRAFGKEHIYIENGGRIEFRTRTSKGGLGEGYDLLIIDEAQEYQDDQESALKYVVTSSKNPQTIFCGTPPTPVSSGTIFTKYRNQCISGEAGKNCGWAEWSVEFETDPHDKKAWYNSNPSLGTIFTERSIEDEIGTDNIDFNIQRLGLWIKYNLKSAITQKEWDSAKVDTLPELAGKLIIGIKYSHDAATVSLAVGARVKDSDKIFVEVIDCRSTRDGTQWLLDFLRKTEGSTRKVIVDGASGQKILEKDMRESRLKPPYLPTVRDIVVANAQLEPAISAGTICHSGQPALEQAATNCEHRAIGSNGGYGYKAIKDGVDISILDAAILARWGVEEFKDAPNKQIISY